MSPHRRRILFQLQLLALVLLLAGFFIPWRDPFQARYHDIRPGMTPPQVASVMAPYEPKEADYRAARGSGEPSWLHLQWTDGEQVVRVHFVNGKARDVLIISHKPPGLYGEMRSQLRRWGIVNR